MPIPTRRHRESQQRIQAMTILIESVSKENGITVLEGTCNTTSAVVCITPNYIQVCRKNASARRNRFLGGKVFWNIAAALSGYKSGEMKALIEAAIEAHA